MKKSPARCGAHDLLADSLFMLALAFLEQHAHAQFCFRCQSSILPAARSNILALLAPLLFGRIFHIGRAKDGLPRLAYLRLALRRLVDKFNVFGLAWGRCHCAHNGNSNGEQPGPSPNVCPHRVAHWVIPCQVTHRVLIGCDARSRSATSARQAVSLARSWASTWSLSILLA